MGGAVLRSSSRLVYRFGTHRSDVGPAIFYEFRKQGSERHKRSAYVIRGHRTGLAVHVYPVRLTVVLDHLGMVNGHQIGLSFEVLDRVAPSDHYARDKCIRLTKSSRRRINKFPLHLTPALLVTVPLNRAKRLNSDTLTLLNPVLQVHLGPLFIA